MIIDTTTTRLSKYLHEPHPTSNGTGHLYNNIPACILHPSGYHGATYATSTMEPMTTPQHILTRVHQYNKYDNHPTIAPEKQRWWELPSNSLSLPTISVSIAIDAIYYRGRLLPNDDKDPTPQHHSSSLHGPTGNHHKNIPGETTVVGNFTYSRRRKQEADKPISVFKTASMARMPINGRRAGTYVGRRSMDTSRQHKHPCHRVCVYEPMDVLHVYACKGTSLGHRGSEAVLRREHNRQARI